MVFFRAGLALLVASVTAGCRAPELPARDLVVVVVDTLRADHVGAYGYSRPTTPEIDRIAGRGTLFRVARTTSSWTVPAVGSLFTSLYPSQHGAYVPGEIKNLSDTTPTRQLADGIETLADRLRAQGYATALFSANPFLYGRFKSGFETAQVERVDAKTLTDAALLWLARVETRPRFLYVHYMDAHQPNTPPEPYFSMFRVAEGGPREPRHGDWSYVNEVGEESLDFRRFRAHRIATYDGAIRFIDNEVARLASALPPDGRPLLVVTSDHGEELWDHAAIQARWRDDPRGFWGIGHGHTLFEEILRIPLIVVGGGFASGKASDCPASLLDLGPTLFAAARLDPAPGWRGTDLEKLDGDICSERILVAESLAYGPMSRALVTGHLKLTLRGDRTLLHDLHRDPAEREELATRFPKQAAALRRELDRELSATATVAGEPMQLDDALRRELKALGYL